VTSRDRSPSRGSLVPSLFIYIPTFGRYESCLQQVHNLHQQRTRLSSPDSVFISVAVNADPNYEAASLQNAGADEVVVRKSNLGGNANIALGFENLSRAHYLWILGDDDQLFPESLKTLLAYLALGTDLLCVSRTRQEVSRMQIDSFAQLEREGGFPGSVSANVFKCSTFASSAEVAFEGIFTSYPHAFAIQQFLKHNSLDVLLHPEGEFIDYSQSVAELAFVSRTVAAQTQGRAFFGGGLFVGLGQQTRFAGRPYARWWASHWHRASMYREARPFQAHLVDRLALTRIDTSILWLLSLFPWWRLKDRIRPRGESQPPQGA
jgi:hypothetical protein